MQGARPSYSVVATALSDGHQCHPNPFIVRPILVLAEVSRVGDLYLLDKLVDIVGSTPVGLGRLFRPIQNGLVQFYALAMALGVTGFLLALMWRYAW